MPCSEKGDRLTIYIDKLATMDDVVAKFVEPEVEAKRATRSQGTIKQLGLAMLNYESAFGHFPTHAIYSKDGKALLSLAGGRFALSRGNHALSEISPR